MYTASMNSTYQPKLFEYTNEYRTWYCVRHAHGSLDYSKAHEERMLYMYKEKVGYCGSDSYRFRTEEDRLIFLLRFGLQYNE